MRSPPDSSPLLRGVFLALAAAFLFGVTAPLVQRASASSGALPAGALLYLGAAIAALLGIALRRAKDREPPLEKKSIGRLIALALLGGMLAPVLLVLGLHRVDAATGALLLALEAPSTLFFSLLIYREHLGRRAGAASLFMFAGAIVLVLRPRDLGESAATLSGALLVFGATVAWAMDNVLSRPLADRDPLSVVAGKGLIGGSAAALAALAFSHRWPDRRDALALLCIGGLGYGVSLQLYLRAQRAIGTARTASVFAAAPFLGAATALLLGSAFSGFSFIAAALLIGLGLFLHSSEHHHHAHTHPAVEHEHAHIHSDGHHHHQHEPMPAGPHSHPHQHQAIEHDHEHSEDLHHHHLH